MEHYVAQSVDYCITDPCVPGSALSISTVGFLPCDVNLLVVALQAPFPPTDRSPYISEKPKNKTVYKGERVSLTCKAQAYPQNVRYTWFKGDVDIMSTSAYPSRIDITRDGQLLIKPLIVSDHGWYRCRATNSMGSDEASAFLDVLFLPVIRQMQTEVTWAKGYNGQLDCPADANPPLNNVKWQKNVDELTSQGRFDILKNGTLLVSDVRQSDAGHYQCTPYNELGPGVQSPRIHVQVKDPPFFVASPDVLYTRNVGDSVKIPCEATGLPRVNIQWIKVGGVLDRTSRRVSISNSFLEIRNLSKSDHGRYECRAINNIATVVKVTNLRIDKTTPHAPFNLTVTPGTFNVTVTWEPAHDGGTAQQYTLWFRRRNQISWNYMKVSPPSATHNRLYSLQPDTEYEFRVVSTNALGNSSFSETVRQRTLARGETQRQRQTTTPPATPPSSSLQLSREITSPGCFHPPSTLSVFPIKLTVLRLNFKPYDTDNTKLMKTRGGAQLWFITGGHVANIFPECRKGLCPLSCPDTRRIKRQQLCIRDWLSGFDPDTVNSLPTYANGTPYYPHVKQNIGIPPTPPRNLTARVRGKQIELRWDSPIHSPVQFFT
ncbi:hypothetical protein RRG08_018494 [Elysia crispata]|uniref:Uncharacterized protein n=1 Tax=Elysia crispata TaxID=231223 RepID=A0AAE0Z0F9_9GAST|nr:hypothetical protein RRG08_018494 [Elysia crispata]